MVENVARTAAFQRLRVGGFRFTVQNMMESNFRRRKPAHTSSVPSTRSLSPKGTIKKIKQNRKLREQQAQEMCNLNVQIGRLEDRDTQQQAFARLIESFPNLDPSLVKEVYALIEKNKKPARTSTRRMLVLLIAALCKCHPVQMAKILPRILSYICLRLRDNQAKTTDACVILVSLIALYVLPCTVVSIPVRQPGSPRRHGKASNIEQCFEAVADIFSKEANAIGEAATRCLCGLLHPVDFDGVSVPGPSTVEAHAKRIRPFFKTLIADTVEKMDGSTKFSSFSPSFLLLQSACQLAKDAYKKAAIAELGEDFEQHIGSIYEAIEDAFQCGPREDWMLRKRALELLTMLLDIFVLQETVWCSTVETATKYFQTHLERVRVLVLAGRHDSVSLVREAAIPAALAFECLEKLCPQSITQPKASTANYDFVPPNPPNYEFSGKRWAKPVDDVSHDPYHPPDGESSSQSLPLPAASADDESAPNFNESSAGDEALPSHDTSTGGNQRDLKRGSSKRKQLLRTASRKHDASAESLSSLPDSIGDEKFTDQTMDHAAPDEGSDEDQSHDKRNTVVNAPKQSSAFKIPTAVESVASGSKPTARPLSSVVASAHTISSLKQFAAKQRTKLRSRHHYEDVPNISLPRRDSSRPGNTQVKDNKNDHRHEMHGSDSEVDYADKSIGDLELTRADAALEAANSGESELAIRLCIVEDDLELLRRTMLVVGTPCMPLLSTAARNALCTAFLTLLEEHTSRPESASDVWLALQWLEHWVSIDRHQFDELDARVSQVLVEKLHDVAVAPTKAALAAAHVLFLLGK